MSRGVHVNTDTELVTEECFSCHTTFAMPAELRRLALADHGIFFYCPNGHRQHYLGKTEADKERERRQAAESSVEWYDGRLREERRAHEHTCRQLYGTRGALARIRNKKKAEAS